MNSVKCQAITAHTDTTSAVLIR